MHVAAKGVVWVSPITRNLLVLAVNEGKCTRVKVAKITFNVQR